ncbi:MAG: hypothetical protein WAW75_08730 [Gallionella sp.]
MNYNAIQDAKGDTSSMRVIMLAWVADRCVARPARRDRIGGGMLNILLIYALLTLEVMFATFIFFCAVLKLRDARDRELLQDVPPVIRLFAYSTLAIGLVLDVALNILLSPILLEPPQEWLTTDRMKRLKHGGNDWQRACARWMCKQLDSLDDNHCGG